MVSLRLIGKSIILILFRPLQREVISTALNGDDVFLQAATSFGKSLCFQLPAVIDFGRMCKVEPTTDSSI
jgi:superfamily II DNA helicase RecQ